MQLRECEYILAIARFGNMGKAAQHLYVSQPTLSKMLTKLEEDIGAPLFERQASGMTPTDVGKVYLENAQRMVELNAQMERELKSASGKQPSLSIGMPMLREELLMQSIFPRLCQRFPGMMANTMHTPQGKMAVDVINNHCALGFGILSDKLKQILRCEQVGEERYVLAVPKGHPLVKKAHENPDWKYPLISTHHLRETPFVLSRPDAYSTRVAQRFFEASGIEPPIALTLTVTRDVLHAVAAGAGVTLLPDIPLSPISAQVVTYLSVENTPEPFPVGVIYRKGYTLSPIESAFIDTLRQVYGES